MLSGVFTTSLVEKSIIAGENVSINSAYAVRVCLYENYKAINYDRDKLSSRGAIIEREPR